MHQGKLKINHYQIKVDRAPRPIDRSTDRSSIQIFRSIVRAIDLQKVAIKHHLIFQKYLQMSTFFCAVEINCQVMWMEFK
jgi:hypothetical protein